VTDIAIPSTGTARVHVLHEGYVGPGGDGERVSGTVTLIIDGDAVIVDPGTAVPDRDALLATLAAHGAVLAPSVRLLRTPGHTGQDISTVAVTADGVYACTHAWWSSAGPQDDPLGTDAAALKASRNVPRGLATVVIPGHGAPFRPGDHA
jgi:glyoxylase-like metal-dependent hydrolase (beta-lactamase superfamily II)